MEARESMREVNFMDMKDVSKIMGEYFETVTPKQFEKDLEDAGILECPNKNDCPINNFGHLEGRKYLKPKEPKSRK
jgi:hypothetical protein